MTWLKYVISFCAIVRMITSKFRAHRKIILPIRPNTTQPEAEVHRQSLNLYLSHDDVTFQSWVHRLQRKILYGPCGYPYLSYTPALHSFLGAAWRRMSERGGYSSGFSTSRGCHDERFQVDSYPYDFISAFFIRVRRRFRALRGIVWYQSSFVSNQIRSWDGREPNCLKPRPRPSFNHRELLPCAYFKQALQKARVSNILSYCLPDERCKMADDHMFAILI